MKTRITLLFLFLTSLTFGQRDFSKVSINETSLTDNIYMLEGSGGNIMLIVGQDEVLMVDSQFAGLSDKIKEKVKALAGDKEIKYLVNTHFHGDHTGGNENFRPATIVAHKNVRKRLSTDQFSKAFNRTTKAKPTTFYPDFTYHSEMQFYFGEQQITLIHLPNAHTDGDSGVFLADANIMHLGDTFFKDRFPFIDLSAGGSINGLIEGFKGMLLFMDAETQVIPGHGDLATMGDAESYLEMLVTMRDRVQAAIKDGKSIEEIKAAGLDKDFESWGTGFISGEKFVDTIWTDLERAK